MTNLIRKLFSKPADDIEVIATEKDSPYYGKDYSKLQPHQKSMHDKFVRGEVTISIPKFNQKEYDETESHHKDYLDKVHRSEISASNVYVI